MDHRLCFSRGTTDNDIRSGKQSRRSKPPAAFSGAIPSERRISRMITAILSSILPVCLLMVLGAVLSHFRFLPEAFFFQMNRLGFWVLLPTLLFCSIVKAPIAAGGIGMKIGLVLCICSVAITLIGWLITRMMRLPDGSARAFMQAAMRGNLAYTALPVMLYTFGAGSKSAAIASFALAPAIPFYNFLAVLILTERGGSHRGNLARAALTILHNPLIIACLLGLFILKSGLNISAVLFNALDTLGQAALPCALLALGAGLKPDRMRAAFRPAAVATVLKLLVMPVIGYALAMAIGFRSDTLVITLLYLASPCAVTSYVMADQMGADKELAGSAIALSTLCCLPVMALILFLFR